MVEERLARVAKATTLVTPALIRTWHDALDAPMDAADTWIHGDLHARNVLVSGGRIAGIIDWSDMAAGDRATDLAAIWGMLASREARAEAMRACGASSEATLGAGPGLGLRVRRDAARQRHGGPPAPRRDGRTHPPAPGRRAVAKPVLSGAMP